MRGETVHLGDMCDLISEPVRPGARPDALYLGLEHLAPGRLVRIGGGQASEMRSNTSAFRSGDVLYGKLRPYLDKAVLADAAGVCTTELLVLRAKPDVEPRFLATVVHSPGFLEHAVAGTTGVQHPRTSWAHIRESEVPAFAPHEQRRTADLLWLVHEAISKSEALVSESQALKRAAMRTLFTRGLRGEPHKETETGPVPESWGQTTLGDLCKGLGGAIQTGPFGSQLHKDDYQAIGVPVVNPTNLNTGRIEHENVPRISDENAHRLKRHRLCIGDIVIARRGQIGRMAQVTKSEEGWLCGTGSFLVRARQPFIDNQFLYYQLSTEPLTRWLAAHAAGAIMPNLNNVVLRRVPLFLPSVDEQKRIVTILDAIDCKSSLYHRKRVVLEELFKSLLNELMTGNIKMRRLHLSDLSDNATDTRIRSNPAGS